MPLPPSSPLLDKILRAVPRRYRVPPAPNAATQAPNGGAATMLAMTVEHARQALAGGVAPDSATRHDFLHALSRLIREAMRANEGDPAFQAIVLRHRAPQVREFASLSAAADQDRRQIHAAVNAIAHPAKLQRMAPGPDRDALAPLQAAVSTASWTALLDAARQLRAMPEKAVDPSVERALARLLDDPALARLRRLDALAPDAQVRRYQSLWDRHGPRSGSPTAAAQGSAAQRRGAAVEALATQALDALAQRLNDAEGAHAPYRVVTSMRVPSSIPASSDRAKSEWDAVLLRQTGAAATPVWDVCLLIEAKASVDAATADLPRLQRGLRLLAHAEDHAVYPFQTRQGVVNLRGASLRALPADSSALAHTVLYCCDAPADAAPRLLSAASRMQLLSAPASVEYARGVENGQTPDVSALEPVWRQLLESPQWEPVLHQYPMLRQVRELMVHVDDLLASV
ncbi:3-deoxy-D-arabino-heptulosonate 7-phosphate synthase [Achromobacter sp. UMC46]|uniref:3-deoxy-D-arabino-heptulosonate 7-phosphate synthase n=1 Tax=Achromobacter sp. UMC46 TaxID=1862319 RepID=UPI0016008376|nr:3-deoxy-D-arabino-heptulosonate 7-phosphate synthase [Achromobacter sp. UMC46]MBB1593356.1 3-deoxy-D-arabino-heptulosonate 7-phosphate synthase [Achromobacter sp. UMC46]